ncbi:hypothetical protein CVT24_010921 [Panaeolus cyanescens]|uniref:ATP-dependent DNA helicase n=1 Tax=Panaeolus cyanescens TaxID=181874 RepID=A0A409YVN8_9AGAR|nr:hypothetical protein CVT24_010921 [Panaeolus cyanescens]
MSEGSSSFVWDSFRAPDKQEFPPPPCTPKRIAAAMRDYCRDIGPSVIEESGCAVCGQLTRRSNMLLLNELDIKLSPLTQVNCAKHERLSSNDPDCDISGPVYDTKLSSVCPECCTALKKGRRPRLALANNLWLGEVPDQLKGLTWAEQAVIARVRHNRCVVRISSGHSKMIGNVIAFEHPTMKVYDILPPSVDELNDVLAVIFTGMEPPTPEDLKRTPVLVRRQVILDALLWLKLNHKDYKYITIDHDTLATYPEEGIPVKVIHKAMDVSEGNVLATAKSVFDNDDEIGTETGPCPFSVHGLTADRFASMTSSQRKGAALQHLTKGGHFLAIGHDPQPQSIYNNPALYPLMFPWLFPYGLGGVGQDYHKGLISRETHLQWLLMYYDKRFQRDPNFVIVAFNQQMIRQSTSGSFMMMKRSNFDNFVLSMNELDPSVLASLATRMREGEFVVPQTPEEKRCFSMLDQIDYIGSRVDGSLSQKKFQRNELWSMISFLNTPYFFITVTPIDNKHPLCLYLAGTDEVFRPEIRLPADRIRIISQNPVACARFFDYMVRLFIQHICGWSEDDPEKMGIFGKPSGYFGTVEQQGRLTLHLHFLLWIEGAPSPQAVRDRLILDDKFREKLIAYLESCQVGECLTGTLDEVKSRFFNDEAERTDVIRSEDSDDPTLTLPAPPPDNFCLDDEDCTCERCIAMHTWYKEFENTVDNILIRSNVTGVDVPKQHITGKGCVNEYGECTARFPREIVLESKVNPTTGQISLKKKEAMMNNISPAITYTSRGNTDFTCLFSGTSVKATVGYVTDYVTKPMLKTHQLFSALYDVFSTDAKTDGEDVKARDHVRKSLLRVVNSLTSKMEIGAPYAALRLLGLPDRYVSHQFVLFYAKNYINYVATHTDLQSTIENPIETDDEDVDDDEDDQDVGIQRVKGYGFQKPDISAPKPGDENVQVVSTSKRIYNKSNTEDYRLRPPQHEHVSVYEWTQCSIKHYVGGGQPPPSGLHFFLFMEDHPQYSTHVVACDPARRNYIIPNFRGPALPRSDEGDREEYCLAMLTLFKPWRTGVDLKPSTLSWDDAFNEHAFTKREIDLMANFNVKYECYDAKDDFYAMREHLREGIPEGVDPDDDNGAYLDVVEGGDMDFDDSIPEPGALTQAMKIQTKTALEDLTSAGWANAVPRPITEPMPTMTLNIDETMTSADWTNIINVEKKRIAAERLASLKLFTSSYGSLFDGSGEIMNDVYVVPGSYISRNFVPAIENDANIINSIVAENGLNVEQERAFRIVANHSTCIGEKQLLMYLGGMGGTGKSRVIKAWVSYFERRNEAHRFVLLGPTGTSAALIGGQTYHSFLGVNKFSGNNVQSIEDLKERLIGVSYLIIDEMSMLSCMDLYAINTKCQSALDSLELPFGGLNIILAGDFAQLPPVDGFPLYSRKVSSNATTPSQQLNYLGKMTWMQFTTVVILQQNMRQQQMTDKDEKLRTCLQNMRVKSCTPKDFEFLDSLIATQHRSLAELNEWEFRFTPIITATNIDKDLYNDVLSDLFSAYHNQPLKTFYSIDRIATSPDGRRNPRKKYKKGRRLAPKDQFDLWKQPPNTSKQVAATLKICLGMPVIIRHNVATELCITNGQEAVIVGWTSSRLPGYRDCRTLDVLYVELTNPPKQIQIPGLPPNVVPLGRQTQNIQARLTTDHILSISRSQIPVLPYFSITDFGAQGKGLFRYRADMYRCRNHQAMYVALSRTTSADGVLILRSYSKEKLCGGLDGSLRQEFRELHYLDTITELQYNNQLREGILDITRRTTIANYRPWKGRHVEKSWHPALQGEDSDVGTIDTLCDQEAPVFGSRKRKLDDTILESNKRHKTSDASIPKTDDNQVALSCIIQPDPAPRNLTRPQTLYGPIWDIDDHSCAYDSWTFILSSLWLDNRHAWMDLMHHSTLLRKIEECFQSLMIGGHCGINPTYFQLCTSISAIHSYMELIRETSVQNFVNNAHTSVCACPSCTGPMYTQQSYGPALCFQIINSPGIIMQHVICVGPYSIKYKLHGIIYFSNAHFTCRAILSDNSVYFHDGLEGGNAVYDGHLGISMSLEDLNVCRSRTASVALYIKESIGYDMT